MAIYTLFTSLKKEYPSIDIHILFQHPSPGLGERNAYSIVGEHCINALILKHIVCISFVFDLNPNKESKCWTYKSLCNCFLSKINKSKVRERLIISNDIIISQVHEEMMEHPIFNVVRRKGWASLRVGNEHCFCITCL